MKDGLLDQVATLRGQQAEIIKTIQAICRVVGPAEVQAEMAAGQRGEMGQMVASAVEKGQLKKAETVDKDAFIVGLERQKDGQPVFPGRFQLFVRDLAEGSLALFAGKKAGDTIDLPNGNKVELTEIYGPVTVKAPKTKKVKAARPAATVNAAVPNEPKN